MASRCNYLNFNTMSVIKSSKKLKYQLKPLILLNYINVLSTSHNSKVGGSSLTHATKAYITRTVTVLVIFYILKIGYDNALKWHYYVKLGKNWVK